MLLLLRIIIIVLTFIYLEHETTPAYVPSPPVVVLPLNKHIDATQPLYSTQITTKDANWMNSSKVNLLIDIDAPYVYYDCILQWDLRKNCPKNKRCGYPYACDCINIATASYSEKNPSCPPLTNNLTYPDWGFCTCPIDVVNPVTKSCSQGFLSDNNIATRDGVCAPSSSFQSFPANVTGVMALSTSHDALMNNLFYNYKKIIALCLPCTSSTPGILYYGISPYYLLPQLRSFMSYTALIKHPGSYGYFIRVSKIEIKNRSIIIPANVTTKISTIDPYTILRTDIYSAVVQRFFKVTKGIRPTKPVRPFGHCFSTSSNGTQVSLKFPDINFRVPEGKKWTMSTANSIKQITKDVACLALVNGGAASTPAIVIGTFQMEDNFVVFDLEHSTFGFSSSLLRNHTYCGDFNYILGNN